MSKTKVSSSTTRNRHKYDDMSDEISNTSSNEDETVTRTKSKKIQPVDAELDGIDYDDGVYDRGSRRRRKRRGRRSRSRRRRSRSRSRRRH